MLSFKRLIRTIFILGSPCIQSAVVVVVGIIIVIVITDYYCYCYYYYYYYYYYYHYHLRELIRSRVMEQKEN